MNVVYPNDFLSKPMGKFVGAGASYAPMVLPPVIYVLRGIKLTVSLQGDI